jgi:hypothetical protein
MVAVSTMVALQEYIAAQSQKTMPDLRRAAIFRMPLVVLLEPSPTLLSKGTQWVLLTQTAVTLITT